MEVMFTPEEYAQKLLEHGGYRGPPVDPVELAVLLGYTVRPAVRGRSASAFRRRRKGYILLPVDAPPVRRRFAAAHEIFELAGSFNEAQCNEGASCLLMPAEWVRQEIALHGFDLYALSKTFGVSHEALSYRLARLYRLCATVVDNGRVRSRVCAPELQAPRTLHPLEKSALREAEAEGSVVQKSDDQIEVWAFPVPPSLEPSSGKPSIRRTILLTRPKEAAD